MNKIALFAWVLMFGCVAATLIAAITRPQHWTRTIATAVVLGICSAIVARRSSRKPKFQ